MRKSRDDGRMFAMLCAMDAYSGNGESEPCQCCQKVEWPVPRATGTCATCGQPICDECSHDEVCCECEERLLATAEGSRLLTAAVRGASASLDALMQQRAAIPCHACGAAVEDDAHTPQAGADGQPVWGFWYCTTHFAAGMQRLQAWLDAPDDADEGEDGDA